MKKFKTNLQMKTIWFVAILLSAAVVFSSCSDDDDNVTPIEDEKNIVELAQETPDLSTLVTALQAADLAGTLEGTGPFTVFAPTNAAFAALPDGVLEGLLDDPEALADVLLYHVVSGNVQSSQLSNGPVATLLTGQSVQVSISGGTVTLNGNSTVTSADISASNGTIHIINQVLLPEEGEEEPGSIASIATATEDLSILVEILTSPGFEDLLAAASDASASLTVFAPTDAAFAALLETLGKSELSEIPTSVVRDIVEYHILGSAAPSSSLANQQYPTLLDGESVTVTLGDPVLIDDAEVVMPDVEASNGIVHVIDQVLLPSVYKASLGTIVEVPLFSNDFTTLVAALKKADLVSTLIEGGDFTVFAPTNAAFEAAGITSLDGLSAEDLTPILLYHVVSGKVMSTDLGDIAGGVVTTLNADGFANFYLSLGEQVYINGSSQVTSVDIEKDNGVIHVINKTLTPPTQTVVDIAVALSTAEEGAEFTTLVALLTDPAQSAVLEAISDEEGNFTIFAPTDAAFDAISEVTATLTDEQISNVLKYHVVPGRIFSTDLSDGITPETVNEETITVNVGEGVTLTDKSGGDDANVIQVNVHGINGVIHVIDKVLIPTL